MQHKITTHKGDTLLLIEVPKDSYSFKINDLGLQGKYLIYYFKDANFLLGDRCKDLRCDGFNLIGKLSTLTDKDVEPFVDENTFESKITKNGLINRKVYKLFNAKKLSYTSYVLKSWNSFLQYNEIDLSKEWVVLKPKND